MAEHGRVGGVSSGQPFKFVSDVGGIGLNPFDYVARDVSDATETWTFKVGGSSGETVNTVTIVYTDSSLSTISTVTKT